MRTANGLSTENSSRVSVTIQGAKMETKFQLQDVRMVKDLPLRRQTMDISKMATTWEHLQNVEIDRWTTILIGQDHGHLTVAEECI